MNTVAPKKRVQVMKCFAIAVAGVAALVAGCAHAATFRAVAKEQSIIVYSTATKPEKCNVELPFSYTKDGERKEGMHYCKNYFVTVGKDIEFCKVTDAALVETKLGKLTSTCK
jgi:hypothetical protein